MSDADHFEAFAKAVNDAIEMVRTISLDPVDGNDDHCYPVADVTSAKKIIATIDDSTEEVNTIFAALQRAVNDFEKAREGQN